MVHSTQRANSKPEEALADLAPFIALARLGLSPNRGLEFVKRSLDPRSQIDRHGRIRGEFILDVHPLNHNRIKLMTQEVGKLSFDYGGFDSRTPAPLDPLIVELRKTPRYQLHTSYIDRFLPYHVWQTASTDVRLDMLRTFLNMTHGPMNQRRREDLKDLIAKLIKDVEASESGDEDARKIYDFVQREIIPSYIKVNGYEGVIFKALAASKLFPRNNRDTFLYGHQVFDLRILAKKFVASKTLKEMRVSAEKLLDFLATHPLPEGLSHAIWENDILGNFDFPNLDNFESQVRAARRGKANLPLVTWNKHLENALDEKDESICRALKVMGVAESRLRKDEYYQAVTQDTTSLSKGPASTSHDSRELVVNEKGRVKDILDYTGTQRFVVPKAERIMRAVRSSIEEQRSESYSKAAELIQSQAAKYIRDAVANPRAAREGFIAEERIDPEYIEGYFVENSPDIGTFGHHKLFLDHPDLYAEAYSFAFDFVLEPRITEQGNYVVPWKLESEMAELFKALLKTSRAKGKNFLRRFFLDAKPLGLDTLTGAAPAVDSASPLFAFLVDHYRGLFTKDEMTKIATEWTVLRYWTPRTKVMLTFFRNAYGYGDSHLTSQKAMIALLKDMFSRKTNTEFFHALAMVELHEALATLAPTEQFVVETLKIIGPRTMIPYRTMVAKFREVVNGIRSYPDDLDELISVWRDFHDAELFPYDGEAERLVINSIVSKIEALEDPRAKIEKYSTILSSKTPIVHPQARQAMVDHLAKAFVDAFGRDDKTEDYSKMVSEKVASFAKTFHSTVIVDALERIADKIEAQAPLARDFQKKVIAAYTTPESTSEAHQNSVIGEWAFLQASKSAEDRRNVIRFLASGGNTEDCLRFGNQIKDSIHTKVDDIAGAVVDYSDSDVEAMARSHYNNFWALGFMPRVALLDNILFQDIPGIPQVKKLDLDREMLEFAIDTAFPATASYHQEAREFLYAYLPGLEASQRGLFVSSLLSGARHTQEAGVDARLLVGMQLAQVLDFMGPVETKLAQTIHSHPQTPSDIRDGMSESKSMANPPNVVERHDIIESIVPMRVRDEIEHIGRLQGAASFFIVVDVKMKDGRELVLKLLRPHSQARLETGFRRLKSMLEGLRDKLNHATYLTLQEIIDHSRVIARSEVDNKSAYATHARLREIYDFDIGDEVKKTILRSRVVDVVEAGDGWTLLQKAAGVDYSQMSLAERKTYAAALSFQALLVILRGGYFDTDRHGGQFRIAGDQIFHFDPGGLTQEVPSDEELVHVGKVIFEIIQNAAASNFSKVPDFTNIVAEHIRQLRERKEPSSYLHSIQKALLASQDYLRLLEPEDLKRVLSSVALSGEVHSKIAEGMGIKMRELPEEKQAGLFTELPVNGCFKVFR